MGRVSTGLLLAEHHSCDWIGTKDCAAFQTLVIGKIIDLPELAEGAACGNIDCLGNRMIYEGLKRRLHCKMSTHRQIARRDKSIW